MTRERLDLGRRGEQVAGEHLARSGYAILARNFRSAAGEIDLVARRGDLLVFVEVRSRRGTRFGTGIESVDGRKRRRLCRAAEAFLRVHGPAPAAVRFDVVGIEWRGDEALVDHVEGAFDC